MVAVVHGCKYEIEKQGRDGGKQSSKQKPSEEQPFIDCFFFSCLLFIVF